MRTGYEIREGSRMIGLRVQRARTIRVEDRGPAGVRPLEEGERVVNGRILYCQAWRHSR